MLHDTFTLVVSNNARLRNPLLQLKPIFSDGCKPCDLDSNISMIVLKSVYLGNWQLMLKNLKYTQNTGAGPVILNRHKHIQNSAHDNNIFFKLLEA